MRKSRGFPNKLIGVNLRQHVIRTDTYIYSMRTGERGDHSPIAWPTPAIACWRGGLLRTFEGHSGSVNSVAFFAQRRPRARKGP
jgi:hypothetical protein